MDRRINGYRRVFFALAVIAVNVAVFMIGTVYYLERRSTVNKSYIESEVENNGIRIDEILIKAEQTGMLLKEGFEIIIEENSNAESVEVANVNRQIGRVIQQTMKEDMNIKEIFYKIDDSIIKENNGYRFYMNKYGLNKIELSDDFYNEIETLRDGLMGQDSWYGAQVSVGDSMWLDPHQSVKNDSMVVPFITFIKCKGEAVGIIGVEIDVNDITENIYKMKYRYY